ncbi:MAG: hypothetical protein KBS80_07670, partial [Bacteroidales bacterium]|nr:hypothetical protein [Candidatus Cryptobacteroides choladohippi]
PFLTTFEDPQKKHFFKHINDNLCKDMQINRLQGFHPTKCPPRQILRDERVLEEKLFDFLMAGVFIHGEGSQGGHESRENLASHALFSMNSAFLWKIVHYSS